MNKYKVVVRGTDIVGDSFLRNVVEVAKLGGELDGIPLVRFPFQAMFDLETKERQTSTATITYTPIQEEFSQKELSKLSLDELRPIGHSWGVKDSSRDALIKKILFAIKQSNSTQEAPLEAAVEPAEQE